MRLWRHVPKLRVVLDSNILVSYLLNAKGTTIIEVVHTAFRETTVLLSQETFDELGAVLDRFVHRERLLASEREAFLQLLVVNSEWIKILTHVQACRDPKDDKFLALALNGEAHYLVTGDRDLLALRPFAGVQILTPRDFLLTFISPV